VVTAQNVRPGSKIGQGSKVVLTLSAEKTAE